MHNTVLAGMSGGVDSSATALLLQEQGFTVAGATLRLHENGPNDALRDAQSVCNTLGIAHHTIDLRADFRAQVIEPFAQSYARGETPNPCIECNRNVKFWGLWRAAQQLGLEAIATGHYVRSRWDAPSGRWQLLRALDSAKDQSYVLYVLPQQLLARLHFPLGCLTKPQVRALAAQRGLASAKRGDSQDICFIPTGDYVGFLTGEMGLCPVPGDFVDPAGNRLGSHAGQLCYTLGQRRGLGVSADRRLFVVQKREAQNQIVLGDEPLLYERRMPVAGLNWVSCAAPTAPLRAQVKSRYRQQAQPALLHPLENGRLLVEFDLPQRALTPGQAAVFYDGDVVLGGGIIRPTGAGATPE